MKFLLLLLALLTAGTGHAQSAGEIVHGNEYHGVIFSAALKLQPEDTVRRWTPTAADIQRLEQDLIGFMHKQPKKSLVNHATQGPSIRQHLGQYTRQYAGYISPKGERIIYVNCVWDVDNDPFAKDWPSRFIQVFDGGSSYWHIHYNVAKRKFLALAINGVA
ncbi:hypothetical protein [Hymenobacter elongatus]|uniref:Uncharacterized protein n=1 Tax=Hymenobacter elongatus TaxID=877208 RepID=A0A4Z0PNK4_9BACT|nr:hypothetical protein [Hymenobacter elongatus]TGE18657.1 hypothetical protein E5J99_04955 [Hymenobacter elongatus]